MKRALLYINRKNMKGLNVPSRKSIKIILFNRDYALEILLCYK